MVTAAAPAESLYDRIVSHLKSGGIVQICTMTKATQYDSRHVEFFKASNENPETTVWVRRGKQWEFADTRGLAVRFGRIVKR